MRYTSYWQSALFRRIMLLSAFTLLLSTSSLLFSQHASAHTQDAPDLYGSDYYQYNYYNQRTSFVGVNFSPNTTVTLIWRLDVAGDVPAGTATTDANGGFTFKIANMPSLPYSTQAQQSQGTLVATDPQGLQASFLVVETPDLIANPTYGSAGDTVTLNGGGYGSNETVNIFFTTMGDANTLATTTTSDARGGLNDTFVIPDSAVLHNGLRATGVTSGVDLQPQSFSITHKINISPNHGPGGTSVSLSSSEYTPDNKAYVHWVDPIAHKTTSLATVIIASDGTFETQITVPSNVVVGRVYMISIEDHSTGLSGFTHFTATT